MEFLEKTFDILWKNQKNLEQDLISSKDYYQHLLETLPIGLGLAAVYGIIKDHFGEINVFSESGFGTTFEILLPLTEKISVKNEKKKSIKKGLGTVLLVDDEELNRIPGKDILETIGYDVLLAEDGMESIRIYKKEWGHHFIWIYKR